MRRLSRFLILLIAVFFAMPVAAQLTPQQRHIAIELTSETDRPAPGAEVVLAFYSRPDPGWHGYWQNPGDAGIETKLDWTLPKGVTAGPLQYPVPHRLMIGGLMNYVYEGPYTQFVTLKLAPDLAPGTSLPLKVKATYLVCTDEICVPETAELSTTLTVGDGAIAPERRARFDGWRQAMPKPLGSPARFALDGQTIRLAVPWPADQAADDAYFFPLSDGAIAYSAPQSVTRQGDLLLIETRAGGKATGEVAGVLAVGNKGFQVRATPGAVPAATASAGVAASTVLLAFGGALLGGLLLNIMPCVFPILSLKALNLVRSGGDERAARSEALAYTAGVVMVCLALGGALLALRAGGATVGWAFQLQDPRVILVLLLLVTAIAFNLAGLFEVSAPGAVNRLAAGGAGGAFLTGALAAFVATPCTGPFMAAALGAALILPPFAAMMVFAGLGIGLALPFLLIGFVPALRRRLPKPGPWMATFRHVMSVPMFLTALALAWVLGQEAGVGGMTMGLAAALVVALALWWTGRRQHAGRGAAWVPGAIGVVAALTTVMLIEHAPATGEPTVAVAGAAPFSEAALEQARAGGKPVFAYFTADWCVTCKVNEKAAIETRAVEDAFAKNGVQVLVGDWTEGDPVLGRFIEQHNRAGVPLYLWYGPGDSKPRVLPQLLTQTMLTDLSAGAAKGG